MGCHYDDDQSSSTPGQREDRFSAINDVEKLRKEFREECLAHSAADAEEALAERESAPITFHPTHLQAAKALLDSAGISYKEAVGQFTPHRFLYIRRQGEMVGYPGSQATLAFDTAGKLVGVGGAENVYKEDIK